MNIFYWMNSCVSNRLDVALYRQGVAKAERHHQSLLAYYMSMIGIPELLSLVLFNRSLAYVAAGNPHILKRCWRSSCSKASAADRTDSMP